MSTKHYFNFILLLILSCGKDGSSSGSSSPRVIAPTPSNPNPRGPKHGDSTSSQPTSKHIAAFQQFIRTASGLDLSGHPFSKDITEAIDWYIETFDNMPYNQLFIQHEISIINFATAYFAFLNPKSVEPYLGTGPYEGPVMKSSEDTNVYQLTSANQEIVTNYIKDNRASLLKDVQIHHLLPSHLNSLYKEYASLIFGNNSILNDKEKHDLFDHDILDDKTVRHIPSSVRKQFISEEKIADDWKSFFNRMGEIISYNDDDYTKQKWLFHNHAYLIENIVSKAPQKVKDRAEKEITVLFTDQDSVSYWKQQYGMMDRIKVGMDTVTFKENVEVRLSLDQLKSHLIDVQLPSFLTKKVLYHMQALDDDGYAGLGYIKAQKLLYDAFSNDNFTKTKENDVRYAVIKEVLLPATNHCPQELSSGLEKFDIEQFRIGGSSTLPFPDIVNAILLRLREAIIDLVAIEINKDESQMFAQFLKKEFSIQFNLQRPENVNIGLEAIWASKGLNPITSVESAKERFVEEYTIDNMVETIMKELDPAKTYGYLEGDVFFQFMKSHLTERNPIHEKDKSVPQWRWNKLGALYILAERQFIKIVQ